MKRSPAAAAVASGLGILVIDIVENGCESVQVTVFGGQVKRSQTFAVGRVVIFTWNGLQYEVAQVG